MSGSLREISFWRSSILRLSSTSGYMNEHAPEHADADEQQQPLRARASSDQRQPEDDRHEAEELHHQDLVDVQVRRVPREHELLRDLLAVALRREPRARCR